MPGRGKAKGKGAGQGTGSEDDSSESHNLNNPAELLKQAKMIVKEVERVKETFDGQSRSKNRFIDHLNKIKDDLDAVLDSLGMDGEVRNFALRRLAGEIIADSFVG